MERAKVLEKLIKERFTSIRAFAKKCGIPDSTVYTVLKNGVSRASVNVVITMCRTLGITVEELDEMASGEQFEPSFEDMEATLATMMARGGKKLTSDQKLALAKLLMSDDED